MRKLSLITIITVTLGAVWLNSCCKHKDKVQEDAIELGVSGKATKAVIDNVDSLIAKSYRSGVGFGVFGYKMVKENEQENATITPTQIFDNVEVNPSSDTDPDWTYSPTRYWDKNPLASYRFIAYWPHLSKTQSATNPYVSEADRVLTIHNIPFWQLDSLDETNDFMTARRFGNYSQGAFTQGNVTKVDFTFSHILAKFVIKAYYTGVKESHIKINSILLTSGSSSNPILNTDGKATFTQNYNDNLGTSAFTGNTPTSTTNHDLYHPTITGMTLNENTYDDEIAPQDNQYDEVCAWLMVPASGWQNLGLTVDYSIGGSTPIISRVTGLTLNTTVGQDVLQGQTVSGKSYVVTLKFDSSGGGVDLYQVLVKDWVDSNVDAGVYNW